tara:strand:+ start:992 stop:2248 length:1257 start_codon:yes stop_codon:yes gene_type:complete
MQETKQHIATKKLVPQLRFKEFEGEWEKHTLKYLLGALVDCEHKTAPYVDDSEYLVVRTNNVKNGQLVYKDIKYTTEEGFKEWTKRTVPKFGDILFTREAPAGESCLVPEDKKVCLGQRMVLLKSDESKMTGQYLSSYLQSGSAIRDISNLSIGTTVTRINIADIYNLNCPVSTVPEQQKIASFLSSVDEKIQQLTKKKALLEQYKKGVMQQLFSGQLRFKNENGNPYPDWEEKRLGEVFGVIRGKGISKDQLNDNGETKCILYGQLYTTYNEVVFNVVSRTDTNEGVLSIKGDLLVPSSTTTTGIDLANVTALNEEGVLLGGDISILRSKLDANNVFYAYYLSNHKKYEIAAFAQGSTIVHLSYNHFKVMRIDIPVIEEQQKIATYLSGIDTKIEAVNNQITQTQSFKKGLLQKMFV